MIRIVVPFLSKRKTASYQDDVRYGQVTTIHPNMAYPAAKVSRVANRSYPGHDFFNDAFVKILGFPIGTVSVTNGQRVGIYLTHDQHLYIDQMGEGLANIVALLSELAVNSGKLFLIEEPENDLHPQALKALLDLPSGAIGEERGLR